MKKEELYGALEYVRDEYLDSAADAMAGRVRKPKPWRYLGIAAVCALLVASVVTLPMNVSDHDGGITTPLTTLDAVTTTPQLTSSIKPLDPPPQYPMSAGEVEQWMTDHILLNDKVDPNGYADSVGAQFYAGCGIDKLFDDVFTVDDLENASLDGTPSGEMIFDGDTAALFWSMTEPVTLGSYVIYTGLDSEYVGSNPFGWRLFGSNEPIDVGEGDLAPLDEETIVLAGYDLLDDVFDSCMVEAGGVPYGYTIDADLQGEYQYYCWLIRYSSDLLPGAGNIRVSGMKLYAAD